MLYNKNAARGCPLFELWGTQCVLTMVIGVILWSVGFHYYIQLSFQFVYTLLFVKPPPPPMSFGDAPEKRRKTFLPQKSLIYTSQDINLIHIWPEFE